MPNNKHLDLTDRTTIETELDKGSSFKTIALALDKDPSTISKEVKLHLTIETVGGFRRKYNACVNRFSCEKRMICRICNASRHFKFCKNCGLCNAFCSDFVAYDCPRLNKPPYVCNGCKSRPGCTLKKHLYHAGIANDAYRSMLSDSRIGISLSEDELRHIDAIVSPLLLQRQSPHQQRYSDDQRTFPLSAHRFRPHNREEYRSSQKDPLSLTKEENCSQSRQKVPHRKDF